MALGILFFIFLGMGLISLMGISALFIVKNQRVKKVLFYCLAVWALLISFISGTALPSNYILERLFILGIGLLSLIGVIVYLKDSEKKALAYALVVASIIIGIVKMMVF